MSVELDVKTKVETKDAEGGIDKLNSLMERFIKIQEEAIQESKGLNKAVESVGKSAKASEKGVKSLAKGFKGVGLALKAAGVGLAIEALKQLREVFMSNQRVADAVSTTFGTLTGVFSQFVGPVIDAVSALVKAEGSFNAISEVVKSLITIGLTPLKNAFQGIKAAVLGTQLVWEKSPFGDNDPTTIKNLEKGLQDVQKEMKNIAVENTMAAVSLVKNFGEAVDEAGNIFTTLKDGVVKGYEAIDVAAASSAANRRTELENQARIDTAIQQGIIEKYDRLAESQRQIRDNDQLTFEERIAANDKLGELLKIQAEEEIKSVESRRKLAEEQLALDANNIDAKVALIEAENEVAAIRARITGFESEQQINRTSLEREQAQERADIAKKEEADKLKEKKDAAAEAERIEKAKEAAFTDIAKQGFAAASQLAGENVVAQKGIAATQATFDTYAAIVGSLRAAQGSPGAAIPGYAIAQAVATGAFGFLQVAKILSTSSPKTSGSGGGSFSAGSATSQQGQQGTLPSIDFTDQSQLGDNQAAFKPARAYVIQQDIKSQSSLAQTIDDRQRI